MYLLEACAEKYFFGDKISTIDVATIMHGLPEATYDIFVLSSCKISLNLHVWSRINSVYAWKSYIYVTKSSRFAC